MSCRRSGGGASVRGDDTLTGPGSDGRVPAEESAAVDGERAKGSGGGPGRAGRTVCQNSNQHFRPGRVFFSSGRMKGGKGGRGERNWSS